MCRAPGRVRDMSCVASHAPALLNPCFVQLCVKRRFPKPEKHAENKAPNSQLKRSATFRFCAMFNVLGNTKLR